MQLTLIMPNSGIGVFAQLPAQGDIVAKFQYAITVDNTQWVDTNASGNYEVEEAESIDIAPGKTIVFSTIGAGFSLTVNSGTSTCSFSGITLSCSVGGSLFDFTLSDGSTTWTYSGGEGSDQPTLYANEVGGPTGTLTGFTLPDDRVQSIEFGHEWSNYSVIGDGSKISEDPTNLGKDILGNPLTNPGTPQKNMKVTGYTGDWDNATYGKTGLATTGIRQWECSYTHDTVPSIDYIFGAKGTAQRLYLGVNSSDLVVISAGNGSKPGTIPLVVGQTYNLRGVIVGNVLSLYIDDIFDTSYTFSGDVDSGEEMYLCTLNSSGSPSGILGQGQVHWIKFYDVSDILTNHWVCESSPTSLQDTIYDIVGGNHATLTGATLPFFTTEMEGSKLFANGFTEGITKFIGTGSNYIEVPDAVPNQLGRLALARADSGDTGSHQGVIVTPSHIYTIDTAAVHRHSRVAPYTVDVSNTDPFNGLSGTINHLGDGCYHNGALYIPAEHWSGSEGTEQHILVFDVSTLVRTAEYDISAQSEEVSGLGSDGTYLYLTSYLEPTVNKYTDVGIYQSQITLTRAIEKIQGVSIYNSEMYIAAENDGVYVFDLSGSYVRQVVFQDSASIFEGLDFSQPDLIVATRGIEGNLRFYNLDQRLLEGFGVRSSFNVTAAISEQSVVAKFHYTENKRQYYLKISSSKFRFLIGNGVTIAETDIPATVGNTVNLHGSFDSTTQQVSVSDGTTTNTSSGLPVGTSYKIIDQSMLMGGLDPAGVLANFGGTIYSVELYNKIDGVEVSTSIYPMTIQGTNVPDNTGGINGTVIGGVSGAIELVPAGADGLSALGQPLTNQPTEFIDDYCLFDAPLSVSFYDAAVVTGIDTDLYLAGAAIGLTADAWILLASNPLFFGAAKNILVMYNDTQSGDTLDQINDYLGI